MTITKTAAKRAKEMLHTGKVSSYAQGIKMYYAMEKGHPHEHKAHHMKKKRKIKK